MGRVYQPSLVGQGGSRTVIGQPSSDRGGASSPEVGLTAKTALAAAHAAGMNVVRWWLFPGTPWQITTRFANGKTLP